MTRPPGSGPGSVTTRFGSGFGFRVVVGAGAAFPPPDRWTTAPTTAIAASTARTMVTRHTPMTLSASHEPHVSSHYPRVMDGPARRERLARSRLYLVLEARPHGEDPRPLLDAALRGGVDVVQLRDKTLPNDALVAAAEPFRAACEEHGALFVLNDRPELVEACGADGVHVGRSDAGVAEARALVGSNRLIGLSASTAGELAE